MTKHDTVFKIYSGNEMPANPDDMAYMLWSSDNAFNFSIYSNAYQESAEALYTQFHEAKGNNAVKDSIAFTLCFIYRHYMELTTKYLYIKYKKYELKRELTNYEISKFLTVTSHNLNEIWKRLSPLLDNISDNIKTNFDIKALGHYISEFNKFDKSSIAMRYPVDNDSIPVHDKPLRLDIKILHDCMRDCMNEIDELDGTIDEQIYWDGDRREMELFQQHLFDSIEDIKQYIELEKKYAESENNKNERKNIPHFSKIEDILIASPERSNVENFLNKLSYNHILVIHNLYYYGRDYHRKVEVWKHSDDRCYQFLKGNAYFMRTQGLHFDKLKQRENLIGTLI